MTRLLFLFISLLVFSSQTSASTRIVFLGDSLTEGYGITKEEAYPYLVEQELKKEGYDVICFNSGISGSTSASGPGRMKWIEKQKPDILFLALGANDGLRALDNKKTKENLRKVIQIAKEKNIKILLAGMKMPPNLGKTYTKEFEEVFTSLAREESVPLIPFILDQVAAQPKLNLADGIHPNPEGHKIIANHVVKNLKPLLDKNK